MPGISVIIPTYNRASCLARAVASCLRQTHPDVEVIVVDDGSTDDTADVVAALADRYGVDRVRYLHQANAGACVARNRGLDEARGNYIQFLDSDDYLDPRKFAVQVAALERSGSAVAVCDYQNVFDDDGQVTPGEVVCNDGDLHARIAGGHCPQTCAPLMRADSIPPAVRFQQGLPRKQDMDFFFRYFLTVRGYDYTPGVCSFWVHHGEQQISDSYDQGTPVYEMFTAAHSLWRDHRDLIPRQNWWMLRRNGLRSARRLYHRGQKREARQVAQKALAVPCGLRNAGGLMRVIVSSLIPNAALQATRHVFGRSDKQGKDALS